MAGDGLVVAALAALAAFSGVARGAGYVALGDSCGETLLHLTTGTVAKCAHVRPGTGQWSNPHCA